MAEDRSMSRQELSAEIESLVRSLRHSRVLAVSELFASTALLLLWYAVILGRFDHYGVGRVLLAVPAIFNAMAWVFWVMSPFLSGFGMRLPWRLGEDPEDASPEYKHLLMRYRHVQFLLYRYSRIRRLLDLLIACQFFCCSLSFIFILFGLAL